MQGCSLVEQEAYTKVHSPRLQQEKKKKANKGTAQYHLSHENYSTIMYLASMFPYYTAAYIQSYGDKLF